MGVDNKKRVEGLKPLFELQISYLYIDSIT